MGREPVRWRVHPSLHLAAIATFAQRNRSAVRSVASTSSYTLLEMPIPPDAAKPLNSCTSAATADRHHPPISSVLTPENKSRTKGRSRAIAAGP